MSDLSRREAMEWLAIAPLAAFGLSPVGVRRAAWLVKEALAAEAAGQGFQPAFFTAHEWETVRVLADLVIPKDERSGSATDAGVPEFMDLILAEYPDNQLWMRGGLAWLDAECRHRFGKNLVDCADGERAQLLDDIAWPDKAPPGLHHGVAFFNRFRDFTASGFWSSRLGVADLRYKGNVFVTDWHGCPPEQLAKLGVRY